MLILTEEPSVCDSLVSYLAERQCAAQTVRTQDIRQLHQARPSLVIADVRRDAQAVLDVLRCIRANSEVPIIVLAANLEGVERVVALEMGADDVLCEPMNPRELLARARAILRRQEMGRRLSVSCERGGYRFEGWELRRAARELTNPQGQAVPLSRGEYALLVAFLEAPGVVLSRLQLMQATRVHEDAYDRSIDVQVLRLRRKIETKLGAERFIRTERGVGYRFEASVERLF